MPSKSYNYVRTWVGEFPWDKRAALPLAGISKQWDGCPLGIGLAVEDNPTELS